MWKEMPSEIVENEEVKIMKQRTKVKLQNLNRKAKESKSSSKAVWVADVNLGR